MDLISETYLMDCIQGMKKYPENYFDLAIVDPPYGIDNSRDRGGRIWKRKNVGNKNWDERPSFAYFEHLKRVSKNQIVWGGNYFADYLGSFKEFVFWDKNQTSPNFSDGELAWKSFSGTTRMFRMHHFSDGYDKKIHPTQKPTKLYKWLLDKYAEPGYKILDTHLGSMSIAIACNDLKFDLTGSEIDKEYFDKGMKRLSNHLAQTVLF